MQWLALLVDKRSNTIFGNLELRVEKIKLGK
jgi:hypothetical protein